MRRYLENHSKGNPVSFHMPGHKGFGIFDKYGYGDFFRNFVSWDITEIPGADNLFHPEGIIKETMENYKQLYDSKESYLLINGTSSGIIGALMAAVGEGGKVLAARNCHKSVLSGMELGKITAEYVYPALLPQGILGPVEAEAVEAALMADKSCSIKAVILPSPNYYGICSDIEAIAKVCHEAGRILIVDQAHGAHLKFFSKFLDSAGLDSAAGIPTNAEFAGVAESAGAAELDSAAGIPTNAELESAARLPKSAEEQGADIVINSIHKTLASFTQSAVLNLMSDRVDKYLLEEKLALVQSTSPSYVLMAGLSANSEILLEHGEEVIRAWLENLQYFYKEAQKIKGIKILTDPNMDFTKINIDASRLGVDGSQLEQFLMDEGIFTEFYTGNILMCMTGIGNTRADFEKLLAALNKLADQKETTEEEPRWGGFFVPKPGPKGSVTSKKELVTIGDSVGKTSARVIIPYPPGIPFVCPGEVITEETAKLLEELMGQQKLIVGVDEDKVLVYI